MDLLISLIRREIKHQPRVNLDQKTIEKYSSLVLDGESLDPIDVVKDKNGDHWCWNGWHRIEAYQRAGKDRIPAVVTQGTERDAFRLSLGANAKNGLPRTNEDKRRAVELALRDEEFVTFSDGVIAEICSVTQHTVSNIRSELESTQKISESKTRTGKDGREYKVQPKKVEQKKQQEPQDGKATKEVVDTATTAGSVAEPEESETQPARSSSDPIKDPRGNPVPENLVDVFSDSVWGEIDAAAKKLTYLIDRAASSPGGFYLTKDMENKNGSRRLTSFEAAKNSIFHCKPYGVCPACGGDGCKHCYQKGFLAKLTYKQVEGVVS